ncbi:MAG TPA: ectonucleotide pyrophosphatase/phosphodiesterase [Ignavibacteriaceae bacterium]|nr:ectonucleotide pyrophosphatase/phosphodiesterase [Ignavibacteriaceae bacterium]
MKYFFRIFLFVLIFYVVGLFAQSNPYVILISFDGFRWDYVDRGITPNFEYIKEHGVSAKSLRPCFPSKTFPNHLSIITGLYPAHHGIISNGFWDYFTNTRYYMGDSNEVKNAKWYRGEAFWETAERQGIKTASYFWPGSEVTLSYRHPTYYYKYEHLKPYRERVDGVIRWLNLPYNERPHFITSYFDATDTYGHRYGPDSPETNSAIEQLDSSLGYYFERLKEINLFDSTDIIVVSDHGMTNVSQDKIINIENILEGYKYKRNDNGSIMMIEPDKGQDNEIYSRLKEKENHYKVYKREEIPEYFHFSDNPLISRILIIADEGWSLESNKSIEGMKKYSAKGDHGYDNFLMDMNGIFYAFGPAFKNNYRVGTLDNIDIYPLLCKIFNIMPNPLIDGKLERIEYILK